ncbi:MAG: DUF5522 domain-containing protein [Chthoniobacterales bacterium]
MRLFHRNHRAGKLKSTPTKSNCYDQIGDPTDPIPPHERVCATPGDFEPDGALSRDFLLRRGRCCQEGCRHCPYGFNLVRG